MTFLLIWTFSFFPQFDLIFFVLGRFMFEPNGNDSLLWIIMSDLFCCSNHREASVIKGFIYCILLWFAIVMLSPDSYLTLMRLSHAHTDVSAEAVIHLNNSLGFISLLFIKSAVADDGRGEGSKVNSYIFEFGAINVGSSAAKHLLQFFRIQILFQRLNVSLYRLIPSVRHLLRADSRGVQVCSAL